MFLKKYSTKVILGICFILAGIIFNTFFIGLFSGDGELNSIQLIIGIRIVQTYLIISGLLLIILSYFTPKNPVSIIAIFSFIFVIVGLILSPTFVVKNYSHFYLTSGRIVELITLLQIISVSLALIIFFIAVFYIYKKSSRVNFIYSFLIVIIFISCFGSFFYFYYLKPKYPANILFNFSDYKKVANLVLGKDILLSDYEPTSNLNVEKKEILRAKFPVIDVHFHFSSLIITEADKKVLKPQNLIKSMDSVGVKIIVNLDDDEKIDQMLGRYVRKYPERFINFTRIRLSGSKNNEWFPEQVKYFESSIRKGARGLKMVKSLGLKVKDYTGKLVPADDPRFDLLWEKVAELGVPVLWHSADPTAFFQRPDKFNERYTQLTRYPEWSYYGEQFPSKKAILQQRENVLKKHPGAIIIGAHMGGAADDLQYIGYLLDTYPNFYVEISSTLTDLGRQPYTARDFFIKYQDRILFGTDGGVLFGVKGWTIEKFYRSHFEFLETDNEFIDYPMRGAVEQGNWKIYGLNLPDDVLEKIYYKNAEKILVGNNNSIPAIQNKLAHFNIR